jgi:hypothetical protein
VRGFPPVTPCACPSRSRASPRCWLSTACSLLGALAVCSGRFVRSLRRSAPGRRFASVAVLTRSGHSSVARSSLPVRAACLASSFSPLGSPLPPVAPFELPRLRGLPGFRAVSLALSSVPIVARGFEALPPALRAVGPLANCTAGQARSSVGSLVRPGRAGPSVVAVRCVKNQVGNRASRYSVIVIVQCTGESSEIREHAALEHVDLSTTDRVGLDDQSPWKGVRSPSPVGAGLLTIQPCFDWQDGCEVLILLTGLPDKLYICNGGPHAGRAPVLPTVPAHPTGRLRGDRRDGLTVRAGRSLSRCERKDTTTVESLQRETEEQRVSSSSPPPTPD